MIGRRVKEGRIIDWKPLSSAVTDILIENDSGHRSWYSSASCTPVDGLGPLPSRRDAYDVAVQESRLALQTIYDNFVCNFYSPWPGCEHGKAIMGNAFLQALEANEKDEEGTDE